MRKSIVVTILGLFIVCGQTNGQTAKDRQEISKAVHEIGNAFFQNRINDFATLWADSSTFITIDGIKASTKHDIVEMHGLMAEIIDTTSSKPISVRTEIIRFIRKDIAIVYNTWDGLSMLGGMKGKPQSGYLTTVLEKQKGKWLVVSSTNARNYKDRPNFDFIPYDGKQGRVMIDKIKSSK